MNIGRKISSKISAGFAKIRALSGRRKPFASKPASVQPSSLVVGHRGIAAGNLQPGKQNPSAENVAKWRTLTGETVQDFVENEEILHVHSSNVAAAQFFPKEQKIMIQFLSGAAYLYSNFSSAEALEFATAASKGGFCWDRIRVRGSRTATQKPYVKLSGPKK